MQYKCGTLALICHYHVNYHDDDHIQFHHQVFIACSKIFAIITDRLSLVTFSYLLRHKRADAAHDLKQQQLQDQEQLEAAAGTTLVL